MRASVMPVLFERHGTHSGSRFGSTASTRGEFEKEATAGKHPATRITASGAATMAVAAAARFCPRGLPHPSRLRATLVRRCSPT